MCKNAEGVKIEQDQALEEFNEKWEGAEKHEDILLLNSKKKTEKDRAMPFIQVQIFRTFFIQ